MECSFHTDFSKTSVCSRSQIDQGLKDYDAPSGSYPVTKIKQWIKRQCCYNDSRRMGTAYSRSIFTNDFLITMDDHKKRKEILKNSQKISSDAFAKSHNYILKNKFLLITGLHTPGFQLSFNKPVKYSNHWLGNITI